MTSKSSSTEERVVSFSGELDLACAGEIRERLVHPDVLGATAVVFDLRNVSFMDSSAIGVFVAATKRIRAEGGRCSTRCCKGQVLRTLEIAGLLDYLAVNQTAGMPGTQTG